MHTRCSQIVSVVMETMRHRTRSQQELGKLERRVKQFKEMLGETFVEHYDSVLYPVEYFPLNHMVEDIQSFGTLSPLDSRLYYYIIVQIKQALRRKLAEETRAVYGNVKYDGENL